MNNYKKVIKMISIIFIVFFLNKMSVLSWSWLTPSSWDLLTISKWNELVTEINNKLTTTDLLAGNNVIFSYSWSEVTVNSSWANPVPYISSSIKNIYTNQNKIITLSWESFTPSTTLSIPSFDWIINSISHVSPTRLDIDLTAWTSVSTFDFIVTNDSVNNTSWIWNWIGLLDVSTPVTWTWPAGIYIEGLENSLWNWVNSVWNDADFTFDIDETQSNWTWPTWPSTGTYYMYSETSGANSPSKIFSIETTYFNIADSISFDYHMVWDDMWTLDLKIYDWVSWITVFSLIWEQQTLITDAWINTGDIDLSDYKVESIKLEYISWGGWAWDAAIDNVSITSS